MLQNYLKIAFRNMVKHRYYTLLNIFGLSIGIAGCLLITTYIFHELSYDDLHQDADQIYRVNLDAVWNGEIARGGGTPPPLAGFMVEELPEVRGATRIYPAGETLTFLEDRSFTESRIIAVDSNFFDIFSFPILAGDPATALASPQSVLLTRAMANKYFGRVDALGESIRIGEDKRQFQVTAILEDVPANSHIQFDMLMPIEAFSVVKRFDWSWIWLQVVTYAMLEPTADPATVDAGIREIVGNHGRKVIERFSGLSYEAFEAGGGSWTFVLQPLLDIYLQSDFYGNRLGNIGSQRTINMLAVVAFLMILMACVNFVNLSTARAANRAREVGVRKALGSFRFHLMFQFLAEAVLFAGIATLIALMLVELSMPYFGQLAGTTLQASFLQSWMVLIMPLFAILIGVIAGAYPAFYLTNLEPVRALKNEKSAGGSSNLRRFLVVCQFTIAIALIASTLVVYQQIDFFQNKHLGFDKEHVIVVSNTERLGSTEASFKDMVNAFSGVEDASFASSMPSAGSFTDFYRAEGLDLDNFLLTSIKGDYEYLQTMNIELLSGRDFSRDVPGDIDGVLLNETAVRFLGWDDPVGEYLIYPGNGNQRIQILGVVKDFNFHSLHSELQPFAIFLFESKTYMTGKNYMMVRLRPESTEESLAFIEAQWKQLSPDLPFEFSFLDDRIDAQFRGEQRFGRVFLVFASLSILIACLGLLGLAAFSAQRRTKEIGIRKVVGASNIDIVGLLGREFVGLVLFSNLIAWPLAWVAMDNWLASYAYRIDLGWSVFVVAGAIALAIALLTVSWQAIRAALANPVDALKYE